MPWYQLDAVPEISSFTLDIQQNIVVGHDTKTVVPGSVEIDFKSPLKNVKALDLRFVGGAVCKHDESDAQLRGSQRLFDQRVCLMEVSSGTVLEDKVKFDFCLQIPSKMPSSVQNDKIQVQYVVVCALSFENGCCWIPLFAREPCMIKQVLNVYQTQQTLELPKDAFWNEDEYPTMSWSPDEKLLMTAPAIVSSDQQRVVIGVAGELKELQWKIVEETKLMFNSNIIPTNADMQYLKESQKTRIFEQILSQGEWLPETSQELERVIELPVHLDYTPSIDTAVAQVRHYLVLKTDKGQTSLPIRIVPSQLVPHVFEPDLELNSIAAAAEPDHISDPILQEGMRRRK